MISVGRIYHRGNGNGRESTIARDRNGRNDPMSTITSTMPPAPAMPAWIPSPLYRMTVEEYEAMVASGAFKGRNRFHLINGYLVERMTQNPPHTIADLRCGDELDRVIPPGWHVRPCKPIRIPGRDSEPEPDRSVVRGTSDDYESPSRARGRRPGRRGRRLQPGGRPRLRHRTSMGPRASRSAGSST